jgi:hypothetical protein
VFCFFQVQSLHSHHCGYICSYDLIVLEHIFILVNASYVSHLDYYFQVCVRQTSTFFFEVSWRWWFWLQTCPSSLFYEISLLSEAHIYIVFGISHIVVVSLYYANEMVLFFVYVLYLYIIISSSQSWVAISNIPKLIAFFLCRSWTRLPLLRLLSGNRLLQQETRKDESNSYTVRKPLCLPSLKTHIMGWILKTKFSDYLSLWILKFVKVNRILVPDVT